MAINFPTTAVDGEIFTDTNGVAWVCKNSTITNPGTEFKWARMGVASSGGTAIYHGDTEPADPVANPSWFNTRTGRNYIWYEDGDSGQWVQTTAEVGSQPSGADGIDGIDGIDGAQGIPGVDGLPGADGADGIQGIDGDKGDTGADGAQGIPGVDGAKGDTGETGADGSDGATGGTGPQGPIGPNGAKGDTGTAGAKGDTGNPGAKGDTGTAGTNGSDGATGGTGPQGPIGPNGAKGDTGTAGTNGSTGAKGDTGTAGTNGSTGAKGDTGNPGAKGDTGTAGATGGVGPQGGKGDTGSTGGTGPQGGKGDTGSTGGTGPQGGVGPQGSPGVKGDTGSTGGTGPQGGTGPKGDTGAASTVPGPQGGVGPVGPTGASVQLSVQRGECYHNNAGNKVAVMSEVDMSKAYVIGFTGTANVRLHIFNSTIVESIVNDGSQVGRTIRWEVVESTDGATRRENTRYEYIVVEDLIWGDPEFNLTFYPTVVEVKSLTGPVELPNHYLVDNAMIRARCCQLFIDGTLYDDLSGVPGESENSEFKLTTLSVPDRALFAREWRDEELLETDGELLETDWMVSVTDRPHYDSYMAYRQELRDWPDTNDFPDNKPTLPHTTDIGDT